MKWYDILIWILFILAVLVVVWYLFGDSPTLEEAILVLLLTLTITSIIQIKENSHKVEMLERRFHNMEDSFIKPINNLKSMESKKR